MNNRSSLKIALVHDALCSVGGAEKVFQYLCEEFQEADIYSCCYNPKETLDYFKKKIIHIPPIGKYIKSPFEFRLSFPLSINAMRKIDLSKYDIILSSSASVAKYVTASKHAKHFCYCYYPTRAVWESEKYFGRSILRYLVKPMLPYFKYRERKAIKRIDRFIAISKDTAKHIKRYYGRNSDIIYCPIDLDNFFSSTNRSDDYLIVSRLEKWKKIDHAIEAFNKLGNSLNII